MVDIEETMFYKIKFIDENKKIIKEYILIKNFCDENNIQNTPTELADILRIIKVFVNKVYFGTEGQNKLL